MKPSLRERLLYIAIGLLVVLVIALTAVYVPDWALPNKRWVTFGYFTLFLFLFLTRIYWNVSKPRLFWVFLVAFFVLHVVVFAPLLKYIEHAFWYVFIMPIEAMLIAVGIKFLLNVLPDNRAKL